MHHDVRCRRGGRPTLVHVLVLLALAAAAPSALTAQERPAAARRSTLASVRDTALLQRILLAEDSRAKDAQSLETLREGLRSSESSLRRVAARALGRLQRPELIATLLDSAWRPDSQLPWENIDAVAQAAQGLALHDTMEPMLGVDSVFRLLESLMANASNRIVAARSLGRLPYTDTARARQAERSIRTWIERGASGAATRGPSRFNTRLPVELSDPVHGLYTLALRRRTLGPLDDSTVALLRTLARYRFVEPSVPRGALREPSARVRRLAMLSLGATGALDSSAIARGLSDDDTQVRRIALSGLSLTMSAKARSAFLARAFTDTAVMVRLEGVRSFARLMRPSSCAPIIARLRDAHPYVMLAAVDVLGGACSDSLAARAALLTRLRALGDGLPSTAAENRALHAAAHALVSLAAIAADSARAYLSTMAVHPSWVARLYAARAAGVLGDATALREMAAHDQSGNVREAAIEGLARIAGHLEDELYLSALGHPAYQVVMAGAQALSGSTHPSLRTALLNALDRISAERRETSRDARMAILARLDSLGARDDGPRLDAYRSDFDSTVANTAAALLSRWTGQTVSATPAPLPIGAEPLAQLAIASDLVLRITMDSASGGGAFAVRLYSDEAPATVARVVRLARSGYYDGLTLHRVVPNFVTQGGSPMANEYVGDGPFMRDELALRSHTRGTLGISTRGRDTGDAQFFVNLVDNFRLDHDYTVFGEIIEGLRVAERVLEGDVMASVRVEGTLP